LVSGDSPSPLPFPVEGGQVSFLPASRSRASNCPLPPGGGGLGRGGPTRSSKYLRPATVLALFLSLVMACSGGGQPAGTNASRQPEAAKEPAVRRLVMSVVPPGTESNQIRLITQTESWQLRPMYEHLIGLDPTNAKFVPMLATEWSLEP